MAAAIHGRVRAETGIEDPYQAAKREATAQALARLPALRRIVRAAADPLATAVRIAIAGNIIDLDATLERVLVEPFAIEALSPLRTAGAGVLTDTRSHHSDHRTAQRLRGHLRLLLHAGQLSALSGRHPHAHAHPPDGG